MVTRVAGCGRHPSEACREYRLLLKSRKQSVNNAAQVFEQLDRSGEKARIPELERTVGRLVMENEILERRPLR